VQSSQQASGSASHLARRPRTSVSFCGVGEWAVVSAGASGSRKASRGLRQSGDGQSAQNNEQHSGLWFLWRRVLRQQFASWLWGTFHVQARSSFSRVTDAALFPEVADVETRRRACVQATEIHRVAALRVRDVPHVAPLRGHTARYTNHQRSVMMLPLEHCLHGRKQLSQVPFPAKRRGGWPGGWEPVEHANTLVVEARLKGSGMRWEHTIPWKDRRERRVLAGRAQAAKRAAGGGGQPGVLRPGAPARRSACAHPAAWHALKRQAGTPRARWPRAGSEAGHRRRWPDEGAAARRAGWSSACAHPAA
jgi:hypothetical protein